MAPENVKSADSFSNFITTKKPKSPKQKQAPKQKETQQAEETTEAAAPQTQDKKIEQKSNEQIDKLNQHLGAIEDKVLEITQKYEELKKSDKEKDQEIKKLSEAKNEARVQTSNPNE